MMTQIRTKVTQFVAIAAAVSMVTVPDEGAEVPPLMSVEAPIAAPDPVESPNWSVVFAYKGITLSRLVIYWPIPDEVSSHVFPDSHTFHSDINQQTCNQYIDRICNIEGMGDVLVEAESRVKRRKCACDSPI
jgi:hypothetical protein